MTRPARACINLPALKHNFNRVRQAAPHSRVMAVIKAHAYGHGLVPAARAMPQADAFGVVSIDEAISLREAGFDQRIVLLEGFFGTEEVALISGYRVDVVLHHVSQIDMLEGAAPGQPLAVWLKIDTGMHRLGFEPSTLPTVFSRLRELEAVGSVRFLSHFACADDNRSACTTEQMSVFNTALAGMSGERSLANSAGVLGWPDSHLDWVRPGIMLYGSSPLLDRTAAELDLLPVMTLGTRLIAVNRHRRGDAVGYGGDWVCPEDMRVGVAALGYGDGYPRHAPSGTPVLVNGERATLIGRVSMDMICIDLRTHPDARVGDEVILWGEGLPVDEVAGKAETIAYELLCGLSSRVQFDYME